MHFFERRRARVVVAGMAVALLGGAAVWFARGARGGDWPELKTARVAVSSVSSARVRIGANVHVSAAFPAVDHMGCVLAADPSDPMRLFCAATLGDRYEDVAGYYSHDGGETWRLGCTRAHGPGEQVADEDVAFGPDGGLYFVNMRTPIGTAGAYRYGTAGVGSIDFAYSPDGGETWEERMSVARYIDRPRLVVDGTTGPYRGRLYVHANIEEPIVLSTGDGAGTFSEGVELRPRVRSTRPSNPIVLSDGALLVASVVFATGSDVHLELPLWRSVDGGRSFTRVKRNLAGRWRHARIKSRSMFDVFYPCLAADPGSPGFAGRIYCVWRDGQGPDESYILFASSADGGATWSAPVVVSEQPAGPGGAPDYGSDVPAIAVNCSGIVAVTWYDRRGLPKHEVGPGGVVAPAPGYNARLRVSCDGGATWRPSVLLNAVEMKGDVSGARYWMGLVAAADGRFHAAWIGDATGRRQVWTVAIEVEE